MSKVDWGLWLSIAGAIGTFYTFRAIMRRLDNFETSLTPHSPSPPHDLPPQRLPAGRRAIQPQS